MTPQTIEFQVFLRSTATLPYPSDIPFDKFIPSPASPGSFTVLTEKKLMAVTAHQVALVPELCTVVFDVATRNDRSQGRCAIMQGFTSLQASCRQPYLVLEVPALSSLRYQVTN